MLSAAEYLVLEASSCAALCEPAPDEWSLTSGPVDHRIGASASLRTGKTLLVPWHTHCNSSATNSINTCSEAGHTGTPIARVSSRIFCLGGGGGEELLGILDHTHFCRYFVLACY